MPDTRTHRSAGPRDRELLAPDVLPRLRQAVADQSWLLSRGYSERSALKLVGDRYRLVARQRDAVARCATADELVRVLDGRRVAPAALEGAALAIDGYNVLTTVEVALGGGAVLLARDGCARDLASLRGTWRRVHETGPALELVGGWLAAAGVARADWYLDASVSNSGRLRALLLELARARGWPVSVELRTDVDPALMAAPLTAARRIVASADRRVLASCSSWSNLAREVVEARVRQAWLVDLA